MPVVRKDGSKSEGVQYLIASAEKILDKGDAEKVERTQCPRRVQLAIFEVGSRATQALIKLHIFPRSVTSSMLDKVYMKESTSRPALLQTSFAGLVGLDAASKDISSQTMLILKYRRLEQ